MLEGGCSGLPRVRSNSNQHGREGELIDLPKIRPKLYASACLPNFHNLRFFGCRYRLRIVLFRISGRMTHCGNKVAGWIFSALLLVIGTVHAFANSSPPEAQGGGKPQAQSEASKPVSTFSEADAAHLLAEIQQAVEANNQRRFLSLFDAAKMPNFASFKDQVAEFFEKYEAFRLHYHLKETSSEDSLGILLADAELEMTPAGAHVPNVRKSDHLRIVAAWDGKTWKIIDWSPRTILN